MLLRITEDTVWRYYNCPDPHWSSKCRDCREKVNRLRVPVQECVDCWKLEIWRHSAAFTGREELNFDGLMDQVSVIAAGAPPVAKASRAPIQVVRTGVPQAGYPDLVTDDLLVFYARSISEREMLRELVKEALMLTECQARLIPVRRGCWRFDPILGPWLRWYQPDSDWQH
jgi:hypothetical protein